MRVTALLTGRGNNTLKDKNILDCLGHPVLYYPAQAAKNQILLMKCIVVVMTNVFYMKLKN